MFFFLFLAWLAQSPNESGAPAWQHLSPQKVERFDYCDSPEVSQAFVDKAYMAVALAPDSMREFERVTAQLARQAAELAKTISSREACREVFVAGRKHHRDVLGTVAVGVRRGLSFDFAEDDEVKKAQLDLVSQWLFDETSRGVLAVIPAEAQDPSVRWARLLAEARMGHVALDSAVVVTRLHSRFGSVDARRFGPVYADQAEKIAQRYGVDISTL